MARTHTPLSKISTKPLLTAVAIFLMGSAVVAGLTVLHVQYRGPVDHFWDRLLVEAYGMLLDVLVIGVFLLWLNQKGRTRLEIQRYHDEIEDFRDWRFQEAAFRIAGNIKRLNRNGVTEIDLSRCTLKNMQLAAANLKGACLVKADLRDAYLARTCLCAADLNGARLNRAFLWKADLTDAVIVGADLRGANLENADLTGAYMQGCDLAGADLSTAVLTGAKGLTIGQLTQAKSLFETVLDEETTQQIRKTHPQLLKPPEVFTPGSGSEFGPGHR